MVIGTKTAKASPTAAPTREGGGGKIPLRLPLGSGSLLGRHDIIDPRTQGGCFRPKNTSFRATSALYFAVIAAPTAQVPLYSGSKVECNKNILDLPLVPGGVFGPNNISIADSWALMNNFMVIGTKTAQAPPCSGHRNVGTKSPSSVTPMVRRPVRVPNGPQDTRGVFPALKTPHLWSLQHFISWFSALQRPRCHPTAGARAGAPKHS
jgi:hypothetical protein